MSKELASVHAELHSHKVKADSLNELLKLRLTEVAVIEDVL